MFGRETAIPAALESAVLICVRCYRQDQLQAGSSCLFFIPARDGIL
jgi:hypothetical protein